MEPRVLNKAAKTAPPLKSATLSLSNATLSLSNATLSLSNATLSLSNATLSLSKGGGRGGFFPARECCCSSVPGSENPP
jgi:hypothetical protein